jgi:hypothetical protein
MQDAHGTLGKEQYSVPISNRFAVLSDRTGPSYGNFSTRTSRDNTSRYPAKETLNFLSPHQGLIKKGISDRIRDL